MTMLHETQNKIVFTLVLMTMYSSVTSTYYLPGIMKYIQYNRCLTDDVVFVDIQLSFVDCIEECIRRTVCTSINYCRLMKKCELNSNVNSLTTDLEICKHCMYLDVRSGDQLLIQSDMPCSNNTCQRNERCGKPEPEDCVNSECLQQPSVVENGFILGNMNNVNSIRAVHCHDNFTLLGNSFIECLGDGNWSDAALCTRACEKPKAVANGRPLFAVIYTAQSVVVTNKTAEIEAQTEYLNQSWIEYSCNEPFVTRGTNVTECINGSWTEPPACVTHRLGQPCLDNAECIVPASECRDGQCKCKTQLSYSYSNKSCVQGCITFADTFQSEKFKKLNFNDDETHYMYNVSACKARCLEVTTFQCKSFEVSDSLCLISASDANDGYYRDASDFTYYQRDCLRS